MKYIQILLLSVFFSSGIAQIRIEGIVKDVSGNAPVLAHAHIGKFHDSKNTHSAECRKDGHFTMNVPGPGIYSLRISAVNHQETSIPLVIDEKDKTISLAVTLAADPYRVEMPAIIGDWNNFNFAKADPMKQGQNPAGKPIYTFEIVSSADTISYQLMGIAGGRSVNGTRQDYYTYDGGGDYRSVIRTKKGEKVTITFDPEELPKVPDENTAKVEVTGNPFLQKIASFSDKLEKMKSEAMKPMEGGGISLSGKAVKNTREFIIKFIDEAKTSGDMRTAQFGAIELSGEDYYPQDTLTKEMAEMILHTVPAGSPIWAIAPERGVLMTYHVDPSFANLYVALLTENPEPSVRANAFADQLRKAYSAKNASEARRLYDLLKKDYADIPMTKWVLMQCNPDAVVQVGKQVPSFEVPLLDGSGSFSDKTMLGKYYMIDFWATWCGPCVGEMPSMHKAYEKFKGKKGFDILSVSLDGSEKAIAPFREKKWKMPWLHAFISGVFDADLAKKFEIAGIPKPILVGPDGKIIAMEEDLRGETLEKTLTKFLDEAK